VYFAGGYLIASRNPQLARADAATDEGLRAIAANTRDWTLTVASQIVAILLTVGGLGVLAKSVARDARTGPTASAALFTAGAALMLVYLGFHMFITPQPPRDYQTQRRRYARLHRVYMVAAYVAFGHLGFALLRHRLIPAWAAWFLLVTGAVGLVTAIVRRPAIADLPLWVHAIAGVLGVALLSR
jgi:succinate dehydrogenase hydrophobic anchor subunit